MSHCTRFSALTLLSRFLSVALWRGFLSVVPLTAGLFALQGASASAPTSKDVCRGRRP